jgi:hypothetical protein
MQTMTLSENAIAVLRFEIKGYHSKAKERRLPAYRELAAAGIMEPVRSYSDGGACPRSWQTRQSQVFNGI